MALIVRFACALALTLCAAGAIARFSAQAAISAMKGRQAAEWRRTVIDLNLVGSYYDDPANQPIWVKDGSPTPAAAELLEALSRADEDGLDHRRLSELARSSTPTGLPATTMPPATSWR